MKVLRNLFTIFSLTLFFFVFAPSTFAVTLTWTSKTDMPFPQANFAISPDNNGTIYLFGGIENNSDQPRSVVTRTQAYNPATDTWSTKADMPTARYFGAPALGNDGKIYIFGGLDTTSTVLSMVEAYDPATDTWSSKSALPVFRYGMRAVSGDDGKIYVIGGQNSNSNYLKTVEAYDPATDTWSTKADMPTARSYMGLATLNGKIYAIGGLDAPTGPADESDVVEIYDPVTDSWTSAAPYPYENVLLSLVNLNGKLYAMGSRSFTHPGGIYSDDVKVYDSTLDTWTTVDPMITARFALGAAVSQGKIYAIGGLTRENGVTIVKKVVEEAISDDITPTPSPVTVTFNASEDTYVRSGNGNRNFGSGTFMRVQPSGDNRALVKFDQNALQSSISGTVLEAKLRVTITDNNNSWGATGRTVDVHRLVANWIEGNGTESNNGTGSGATWNCAIDSIISNSAKNCSGTTEWEMGQPNNPSVHPWVQTATDSELITNNQTGVVEYDVTSDVTAFMNGTNNYGWLIKKTNEGQNGQVSFGTRESASDPQLVVTYQP